MLTTNYVEFGSIHEVHKKVFDCKKSFAKHIGQCHLGYIFQTQLSYTNRCLKTIMSNSTLSMRCKTKFLIAEKLFNTYWS